MGNDCSNGNFNLLCSCASLSVVGSLEEIMVGRPTLEDQIALSKMSGDELIQLLRPHTFLGWCSFYLHWHCESLWHVVCCKWFDIWEGTEDADGYRCWAIRLKRRLLALKEGKLK